MVRIHSGSQKKIYFIVYLKFNCIFVLIMKTILFLILTFVSSFGVSQTNDVVTYFNKVSGQTEFTGDLDEVLKWEDDIVIFVKGEKQPELINELNRIIKELNDLIIPITIKVTNNESESNFMILFGSHTDYPKYEPIAKNYVEGNYGLFVTSGEPEIVKATMYVDIYRTPTLNGKKHLLREELTQALGLVNDTYDYKESIFYQGWTETTEYSNIDKELIKMLYNN